MNLSTDKVSAFMLVSSQWLVASVGDQAFKMRLFKGHHIQTMTFYLVTIIFSPQGPGCYNICPGRARMGKNRTPGGNKRTEQQEIVVEMVPSCNLPGKLAISQCFSMWFSNYTLRNLAAATTKSIKPYVQRFIPIRRLMLVCVVITLIWNQI